MKIINGLTWTLGLLLGAACGGDSDSGEDGGGGAGTGGVDTGVPEATPLEDVTPAQYANACEAVRAEIRRRLGPDESVRGACEVLGGGTTNVPAECRASADTCVDQVNAGTHPFGITRAQLDFTTIACGDTGGLAGCSVTVGEFETCSNDRLSTVEKVLADNDCDHAASVDLTTALALTDLGSMSPPSCARLDSECPNVGLGQPPQ